MGDDDLIEAMVVASYGGTWEDALVGLGVDGLDFERKAMHRVLAVIRAEARARAVQEPNHAE